MHLWGLMWGTLVIFQLRRRFAYGLQLSPVVDPFILNILFVYSICLQVVIPLSPQAVLKTGPRVLNFYVCLLQGVCIASQSKLVCLHYIVLVQLGIICVLYQNTKVNEIW